MADVWTLNVSRAGTHRAFSIEDKIWDGEGTQPRWGGHSVQAEEPPSRPPRAEVALQMIQSGILSKAHRRDIIKRAFLIASPAMP
jgi:hypothetical protein